jgi:hypothetical protein
LNVPDRALHLHVSDEELEQRKQQWQAPPPVVERGYVGLYIRHVEQAHLGADMDFLKGRIGQRGFERFALTTHDINESETHFKTSSRIGSGACRASALKICWQLADQGAQVLLNDVDTDLDRGSGCARSKKTPAAIASLLR